MSQRTNIDLIYLLIVLLELAEKHEHTDKKFGNIRQELIDYFQFWLYPKIHLLLSIDYKSVLSVMGRVYKFCLAEFPAIMNVVSFGPCIMT